LFHRATPLCSRWYSRTPIELGLLLEALRKLRSFARRAEAEAALAATVSQQTRVATSCGAQVDVRLGPKADMNDRSGCVDFVREPV
jgi:hypothetical protein